MTGLKLPPNQRLKQRPREGVPTANKPSVVPEKSRALVVAPEAPKEAPEDLADSDPIESSDSESELLAELAKLRAKKKSAWRVQRPQANKVAKQTKVNDTVKSAKHKQFMDKFVR